MLAFAACAGDGGDAGREEAEVAAPASQALSSKAGAPGVLVSPELFDVAAQWSAAAPSGARAGAEVDLVRYVREHAPELAEEAAVAAKATAPAKGGDSAVAGGCTCAVWATFNVSNSSTSGDDWYANHAGAAHQTHIYQYNKGGTSEKTVNQPASSANFRTRMNCMTPEGSACAAGCTAKLYADVQYGSRAFAEAHTWTIWNKAGTTQVVDGVTLNLRTPFGGMGQNLFEKEISASKAARSTTFDVDQLANFVKSSLGITAAIKKNDPDLIGELFGKAVKSLVGIIHGEGSDGWVDEQMNVSYESYFDQLTPITMSYSSADNLYYGLDLTSLIKMKVRGYGYHSETGELKSSYSMATYVDNFVCDPGVTTPPQRAGFWRYDGYDGAPLSVGDLQSRVNQFFNVALGINVNTSDKQGTIYQGVCGNNVCDGYETPQTCALDCGYCGDGTCRSTFESASSCVQDCGYCGDGTCYGGEDANWCIADCGWCGDGTCAGNEDVYSCGADCAYCGDGVCSNGEWGWCTMDCGGGGGGCDPYATAEGGDGERPICPDVPLPAR
jgi:hypothetical protein